MPFVICLSLHRQNLSALAGNQFESVELADDENLMVWLTVQAWWVKRPACSIRGLRGPFSLGL